MATSVITADTPMIMPSIVKAVRILLRLSALKAIRKVMTGDMALASASAAIASAAGAAAGTAAAVAAAGTSGRTAAATRAHERREAAESGPDRFGTGVDVRGELGSGLDLAVEQLG